MKDLALFKLFTCLQLSASFGLYLDLDRFLLSSSFVSASAARSFPWSNKTARFRYSTLLIATPYHEGAEKKYHLPGLLTHQLRCFRHLE